VPAVSAELLGRARSLEAVRFDDGEERVCRGMLVATHLHQRSDLARRLGVAFAPADPLSAEGLALDPQYQTSVPGVYAAGDVAAWPPSVARAVAAGNFAGAMVVMSLATG
jgi:thioredoxin reductase